MYVILCAWITFFLFQNAGAFDCKLAQTPSEKLICSDKSLQEADQNINNTYQALLKSLSPEKQAQLKAEQKAWLSRRDRQCPGTKCLLDYMNERRNALTALGAPSAAASGISCKPYGKRGAPAGGRGNSSVTTRKGDEYTMDCE